MGLPVIASHFDLDVSCQLQVNTQTTMWRLGHSYQLF